MNSMKHEEILCSAQSETKSSIGLRMVLAAFALLLSLHAHAAQGYAVLSADQKTLTFRYGTPMGTQGVDYFDTDETNFNSSTLRWSGNTKVITTVVFELSFRDARPNSCKYWFYDMRNLYCQILLNLCKCLYLCLYKIIFKHNCK